MKLMQMLENYNSKLINLKVLFLYKKNKFLIFEFSEKLADERNKCRQLQKMMADSSVS